MTEFVDACRQEWSRLGVPDPVANEMAADLEADLNEASAEGVSAEEVLGSGAFDPRAFAAEWATERGVVPPPAPTTTLLQERPAVPENRTRNRTLAVVTIAAGFVIAFIGLALATRHSASISVKRVVGPLRPFGPDGIAKFPGPFAVHNSAPVLHGLGVILFLAGAAALIVATVYWSRRTRASH